LNKTAELFPNLGKAPKKEDTRMTTFKEFDIRTVDPNMLVDAESVSVNMDLPIPERMLDVAKQMNNAPHYFRSGRTLVKVSHIITDVTLNNRLESHYRTI
jgi:hypothetical protein